MKPLWQYEGKNVRIIMKDGEKSCTVTGYVEIWFEDCDPEEEGLGLDHGRLVNALDIIDIEEI